MFLDAPYSNVVIRHCIEYVSFGSIIPSSDVGLPYLEHPVATSVTSLQLSVLGSAWPDTMHFGHYMLDIAGGCTPRHAITSHNSAIENQYN